MWNLTKIAKKVRILIQLLLIIVDYNRLNRFKKWKGYDLFLWNILVYFVILWMLAI